VVGAIAGRSSWTIEVGGLHVVLNEVRRGVSVDVVGGCSGRGDRSKKFQYDRSGRASRCLERRGSEGHGTIKRIKGCNTVNTKIRLGIVRLLFHDEIYFRLRQ